MDLVPSDEYRHVAGSEPSWSEWWTQIWWDGDGALGGSVSLELAPHRNRARVWVSVVGRGRNLITIAEDHVPMPADPGLEVRASGLWADPIVETPMRHFSVGLEAFAVSLDDPGEALRRCWGDRVPLGLDLEWESDGIETAVPLRDVDGAVAGYGLHAAVHGDVLVSEGTLSIQGWGWRSHGWGVLDWSRPWSWSVGRFDDGEPMGFGDTRRLDRLRSVEAAPVAVDGPDGRSHLDRALVRFEFADGRSGTGWSEKNRPQD